MNTVKKIKYLLIGLIALVLIIIIAFFLYINVGKQKLKLEVNSNYDLYTLLNEKNVSNIEIVNSNIDMNKLGNYEIELKIVYASGKEKNKKLEVEVVDTTKPIFSGNDNIELIIDEEFNPLEYVKAIDNYDGDISDKITILSNTTNTKVEGKYKVTFSVVDSNGNQETFNLNVNVMDKKYVGINLAIKYLTGLLKNPDSLKIKEVFYDDYSDSIANYDVITIKYSAQNGFGGNTIETSYINVYLKEKYAKTNPIGGMLGIVGEKIDITSINEHLGTNY